MIRKEVLESEGKFTFSMRRSERNVLAWTLFSISMRFEVADRFILERMRPFMLRPPSGEPINRQIDVQLKFKIAKLLRVIPPRG